MILELKKIKKIYASPSIDQAVTVLNDISLDVFEGESLAIVGSSGSGKSTLLNIIGALDKPTSGSIKLSGKEYTDLNENELAAVRNQEIGFVFQLHHLLPQCSVLENVLIPTIPLKLNRKTDSCESRAKELLKRVGLKNHLHHRPGQLSGGELQRVAVVRALINQPKLLLADEPTGSLDQISSENLALLLLELNQEQGVTLIVVTHSMDIARKMNKIHQLNNGRLENYSQEMN
jgi:ABC-type lipoprotein export system ATPase subunit